MSFDLKAAREMCSRIKGYEDPDGGNFADFQAAEMLPAALDEIERLQTRDAAMQAQIVGDNKHIAELEAAHLKAQNSNLLRKQAYESLEKIASKQAKRIAELEESLQRERAMAFSKIQRQRHAITRLSEAKRERGKALVEERARRICHAPGDSVGHWARYEPIVVDEAREQLRREGKL